MRYHVLGVGSIGSLIAFHLKRSIKLQRKLLQPGPSSQSRRELLLSNLSNKRPASNQGSIVSSLSLPPYVQSELPDPLQSSVTLHMRRRPFGRSAKQRFANSIILEQDGVRDIEGGFQTDFTASAADITASIVRDNRLQEDEDDTGAGRFTISRGTNSSSSEDAALREQTTSRTPVPDHDGGVSLISTLEGVHSQPRAGPIDSLIITTKCDSTLSALEAIRHRLHPWSTIVLLQNGMGVLEMLFDRFFKDADQRPNFVLASTTHGCWKKGPLDVVHASMGTLHFGIVPSARAGSIGFESSRVPLGQTLAVPQGPMSRRRRAAKNARGWDRFSPDADAQDAVTELNPQDAEAPSKMLSLSGIPDQPSLRTLRTTVAALLSLPLQVEWETIRDFQLRSLRKLVINACINPLTALADCKNGDLFGNPAAMDAMWTVCLEAGMVLEAQVREHLASSQASPRQTASAALSAEDLILRSTETGEPMLHPSLTPQALYQEVQRVARLTAANWSSMHSDLKNKRGSTEIDYINGYISALGRGYNIDTTANDLLTNLIKLKTTRATGTNRL
ncbi:hypothetical protein PANT_9c00400 [Moesziomyces antarcticus T-34]|uniref:2-dehydropantoate 2-reductase n=1 Tax=Pseudozyma antarctica (strain T-34) TaxID=1151754 RepID=M9LVP3_PSEA3|nr:hypothetical protein PANT_9c00400 [Moesziomyces antarcticus T-34]